MAEGAFRHLVNRAGLADVVSIDSAGTGAWHVGQPPDARARATAAQQGIDISAQRARQVSPADFSTFDYILAMDSDNLETLLGDVPPAHKERVTLFLAFGSGYGGGDVPDPYYGGPEGFETVFEMVTDAAGGLLRHIQAHDLDTP
jgi:protein-tyrosine phosphatase